MQALVITTEVVGATDDSVWSGIEIVDAVTAARAASVLGGFTGEAGFGRGIGVRQGTDAVPQFVECD